MLSPDLSTVAVDDFAIVEDLITRPSHHRCQGDILGLPEREDLRLAPQRREVDFAIVAFDHRLACEPIAVLQKGFCFGSGGQALHPLFDVDDALVTVTGSVAGSRYLHRQLVRVVEDGLADLQGATDAIVSDLCHVSESVLVLSR